MKQVIPALAVMAAAPLAFGLPAMAAVPASFTATGTAHAHATANAPEIKTPLKIFYQNGNIRLEMKSGTSDSVIISQKGKPTITMIDMQQKVALTVDPGTVSSDNAYLPLDQLLDLTSWKSVLQKQGKKLAGTEVKAGQTCSIWEATMGGVKTKVWFADAVDLPMQIQRTIDGKPTFTVTIQSFNPKGQVAPSLFTVPAGFKQNDL